MKLGGMMRQRLLGVPKQKFPKLNRMPQESMMRTPGMQQDLAERQANDENFGAEGEMNGTRKGGKFNRVRKAF